VKQFAASRTSARVLEVTGALANDDAHCSMRTLHGLFVFSASGHVVPASGPDPQTKVISVSTCHHPSPLLTTAELGRNCDRTEGWIDGLWEKIGDPVQPRKSQAWYALGASR
jgi:hypothetical protein